MYSQSTWRRGRVRQKASRYSSDLGAILCAHMLWVSLFFFFFPIGSQTRFSRFQPNMLALIYSRVTEGIVISVIKRGGAMFTGIYVAREGGRVSHCMDS